MRIAAPAFALLVLGCGTSVGSARAERGHEEPPREPVAQEHAEVTLSEPIDSQGARPARVTVSRVRLVRPFLLAPDPSCAPSPPEGPPRLRVEAENGDPPLAEAVIRRALRRSAAFMACGGGCDRGADRLRVRIDEAGGVRSEESIEAGPRAECLREALESIRFPEPRYGQVEVELVVTLR